MEGCIHDFVILLGHIVGIDTRCLSDHFCNGKCSGGDKFCSDDLPFRCYNTTFVYGNLELDFCVSASLVCDGKADCDKGEDEENCIRMSLFLSLTIY